MIRIAILVAVLLAPALCRAQAVADADEIVAHHVAARGGLERLRAIRSIVSYFAYNEPGTANSNSRAVMALMRPYYKLVGDPDRPSREFAEGWDGAAWEFYGDPGVVLRTVGAASAATRHHASIDSPLVDYRRYGTQITYAGPDQVGGRDAYRLRVTMADGFEEDELIDAATWMLVATRKVAKVHAFGAAVETETRFSDFRKVNSVVFAFRTEEVEIGTNRVLNEGVTSKIVLNRRLDPAVFSPPAFRHTPLQRLMELLFAQRDDAAAALWSHADFRRAYPGVDTDVAMQVIGYQMLKMGQAPAAVALLEQNGRDYPRSSNAAFGLARAYESVGRAAEARTQLDRALALDPHNERARELLERVAQESATQRH